MSPSQQRTRRSSSGDGHRFPHALPSWSRRRSQLLAGSTILLKHASNKNLYVPHTLTEYVISEPRVRGVALTGSLRGKGRQEKHARTRRR
jgi:hypothetical protein